MRAELKGSADNAIHLVKADGNASIHVGSDYNIYLPTERQQITQDSTIFRSLSKQIMLVPYYPANRFQGRFRELNDIHDYFRAPRATDERQLRIVSIRGLGGMGKTQLAPQYIFNNKQSYRGIFWLLGEDRTILQQDYAQIARRIDPANSLANAYNNSGSGYLAVGENDKALYLFQQALSIKRIFGDEESMPY